MIAQRPIEVMDKRSCEVGHMQNMCISEKNPGKLWYHYVKYAGIANDESCKP